MHKIIFTILLSTLIPQSDSIIVKTDTLKASNIENTIIIETLDDALQVDAVKIDTVKTKYLYSHNYFITKYR